MKISSKGIDLIKAWEGCLDGDPSTTALDIYIDLAGHSTIGWGHLVKYGENFNAGITRLRAVELLKEDLFDAERCVNYQIRRALKQNQYDSIVSWTFNLGGGALSQSTLLRVINDGQDLDVPAQILRWNKAGGKTVFGLTCRRMDEARMWLGI